MKRAIMVIVVLACILLMPYASANVEITCSVYPEEADFKSDFVYSITLTNSGFMAIGNLSLIAGPDSDNRSISGEWNVSKMELEQGSSCVIEKEKIMIPKEGSCTVKKGVAFTLPELNQGAFRDWTGNPKSPAWNKTWYECCFTSTPFEEEVCCEGSGEPILTHCIEKFREHHVEQNGTYNDLSFDYYIKVWANCKDRIELQVRNYSNTSSSGWDKHFGLKDYTGLDVDTNKTLTFSWHAVNLTPDNFDSEGRGEYKFVGYINNSQPYIGPRIEERIDDPKVSYKKRINELLSFDYEVSVWVDMVRDSIKLEVYNYTLRDWEQKGIRNYTTAGKSQKLRWESINLNCDHFDGNPLSGKYRFVGTYKTSSTIIMGPVIEERFYTLDVTPKEGTNVDSFNYTVTVNANISDKIMLQVKNHTTNLWDTKGTREYKTPNTNETLTWQNIKLNPYELNRFNDSMFRFEGKCGTNSSEEGLRVPIWPVNPVFRTLSVKPDRGFYSDNFNYGIDVKAEKKGTVNLSIFCPDGSLLYGTEQDYNRAPGGWQRLNWSANFSGCEVKTGAARYRFGFRYKGSKIIRWTEEGPYIWIAELVNETVEPEIGTDKTLFNYTINVTAAHVGTVELLTKCPDGAQWVTKGEKEYETPKTTKTLTWTGIELPCDNFGNAEYKFRFEPGYVDSVNYHGPEIIEEKISDFSVFPNKGSNTTTFNFSATVSSTKVGTIPVVLQVSPDRAAWLNVTSSTYDYVRQGERIPIFFTGSIDEANLPSKQKEELISKWNTTGVIYWRITGFLSQSDIIATNWAINQEWHNLSCSPKEGWWNETYYNFNVTVSAGVSGVVELWLKTNTSYLLATKEYGKKGSRKDYNWRVNPGNVIGAEYEGGTEYEFIFKWGGAENKSGWIKGPQLYKRLEKNISDYQVYPASENNYIFSDGDVLNHFTLDESSQIRAVINYSVNVSANKATNITLVTIYPSGKEAELETKQYTGPERKELKWTVKLEDIEQSPGNWAYYFKYSYYDPDMHKEVTERCSEKEGPAIKAILYNFAIVPEYIVEYGEIQYGDMFNLSCDVTGTKAFNVSLFFFCNGKRNEVGTVSYRGE